MNDIIEQYYENYNYPSVDKLYKLLKDDKHDVKKMIYKIILINKKKPKY